MKAKIEAIRELIRLHEAAIPLAEELYSDSLAWTNDLPMVKNQNTVVEALIHVWEGPDQHRMHAAYLRDALVTLENVWSFQQAGQKLEAK